LSELFKQTVGILNEAGVRAEPDMILAAIMPTLEASRILSAFGRTFGVATRLRDGNVPCRRLSEIDSMFSWMTKILTVNSDFLSSFIQILSKA
jgi:hypothetical protein